MFRRKFEPRIWLLPRNNKIDPVTGLYRSHGDTGRSGHNGCLEYEHPSLKCYWKKKYSRCPKDCVICGGEEPGCQGGWERKQIKLRKYQESIDYVVQNLRKDNDEYMRHLAFFRTLACLYYLRIFTLPSRNPTPSQVFFSLYDQRLTVQRNPHYPVRWLAFQNRLDEACIASVLLWKIEKRRVVLSPKQRKNLMCLGGSTRLLVMFLVSNTQRYGHLRSNILRRLFGKKSICRLIRAGGLDPNNHIHQCGTRSYFGN